jgi:exoribonuclease R
MESDRLAIVIEMVIAGDGTLQSSDLYRAAVRNHAKLAYNSVAGWRVTGQCRKRSARSTVSMRTYAADRVAQKLKTLRHVHGALNLETMEGRPVFDGDDLKDFEAERKNQAREIIEDFMIGLQTELLRAISRPECFRRCGAWSAHPNAGTGLSNLPYSVASRCPRSPIQRPWSKS